MKITQHDRLKKYYTFIDTPRGEYWDFDFSESRFQRRYFIQVHRQVDAPPHEQPDCIYVYFRTEGQTEEKRIELRNRIINNLGQLINKNGWSFSLKGEGKRLGDGNIKYRIVNKDLTSIDDHQKMIDIMILIAENLPAIEAEQSIVTV